MVTHHLTRIFYPVGQGGFYSEQHNLTENKSLNIVYDCGAMPLTNKVRNIIRNSFSQKDDIDALFISHLDYDHVSAIPTLVQVANKIKKVFLPLLTPCQKILLTNIYRVLNDNFLELNFIELINNPETFFGTETEIIYIEPEEDISNGLPSSTPVDIYSLKNNDKIRSGSKIRLYTNINWIFVPYNFLDKNRSKQFTKQLEARGFDKKDIPSLFKDENYTITKLINQNSRKLLKDAYKGVEGTINENSMLLYSGPESSQNSDLKYDLCDSGLCTCVNCDFLSPSKQPGCLYTGDLDLNKLPISELFEQYNRYIGTVQLPHHGSRLSFEPNAFHNFGSKLFVPVSFGSRNSYGHPALCVINYLTSDGKSPLLINENEASKIEHEIFFTYNE
ncbi:MBL fold metallo-hydrolase [Catenovulum sp. 2E275]|uniref:MBL fold metallo-hydrolase n=1 Tax=Catenovulum sp. 2E275 TaxID=2980497 RepID=UPI0021D3DD10|nr:MBL fold metallo-hydrolase [Catenovulum sp. 2E275]MCU4676331.1 MBL fold metallo-hydrolase [Catenovulum sp. 2E275]